MTAATHTADAAIRCAPQESAPIWQKQGRFFPQQVTFPMGRRMRAGFRARWSPHSHHSEPSLFSTSLTLHEIRVVFALCWTHPLPSLFPPFFENMAGKWCRQFLGFLSNSSSAGRQAGKRTTVIGVSASPKSPTLNVITQTFKFEL